MELRVVNLLKIRDKKKVLDGITFSLKTGNSLALKGGNGTGKTTLLGIIAGTDKDYKGEVVITDNPAIGYVPQDIALFEKFTVKDNLKAFCNGKNSRENFNRLEEYSEKLGLTELFRKKVCKLSGGQKRLVNFIVGFANNPKIILLDEIIVGMDENTVEKVIGFINEIKNDKIMIITSHQAEFADRVCNIFGELKAGRLQFK